MISNSFFAGLESFMEDDQIQEPVDVASEDAVAEETDSADEAAEVTEAIETAQSDAEKAEMVFAKFEEIDRMIAHVETYGVDRSFLSICNHDNVLGNSFGIVLPSCESFDAVGDPYSATSMAAMEGFGDALKSVWEWIKKMCAKIRDFFKNMWNKIVGFFSKKADKVEKAAEKAATIPQKSDAERTPEQKEEAKKEVMDPKAVKEVVKTAKEEAVAINRELNDIDKAAREAESKAAREEISAIAAEYSAAKKRIYDIIKHNQVASGKISENIMKALTQDVKALKGVIGDYEKIKSNALKKIDDLEREMGGLNTDIHELGMQGGSSNNAAISEKRKQISVATKKVKNLQKTIKRAANMLESLQVILSHASKVTITYVRINTDEKQVREFKKFDKAAIKTAK